MKGALYEINDPIRYIIRCYGDAATANPSVDVLDVGDVIVATHTVGVGLTRIGLSRMFTGSFTPTTEGIWSLHHTDAHGGDTVKSYSIGLKGIQSIAIQVDAIDGKVDVIDGKIDDLQMDIDTIELVINALPGRLDDVDTAISAIDVIVSGTDAALISINSAVSDVQTDVTTANTKLDTLLAKDSGIAQFG